MLIDFNKIEELVQIKIIGPFDTNYINDAHTYFKEKLPTTENLAIFFFNELKDSFPENVVLFSVEVSENEDFLSRYEIERN